MNATRIQRNGKSITVVESTEVIIRDIQSAIDFAATIMYQEDCHRIAVNKEAIAEEFFVLSSRLAGDVLQKFVNYQVKFAIYGEFSHYTSKPLNDFIYESNRGNHVFFTDTKEAAVEKLSLA
ncbi:MAG: DUF4180 domain-containing protein [Saccharofermentanales bacterium]